MRLAKVIILSAISLAIAREAYAWNSDGAGHIRCADGSSATAVQQSDGTWTVTQAGKNGKAGGSFPTEGKAALYACGE